LRIAGLSRELARRERHAVVGQHRVHPVGHGLDRITQERTGRPPSCRRCPRGG
jgi:hypothetical protein